jgi:hypothetical protein
MAGKGLNITGPNGGDPGSPTVRITSSGTNGILPWRKRATTAHGEMPGRPGPSDH